MNKEYIWHEKYRQDSGFSLVEAMIMAVILAIAAASSITLYTMTVQQSKQTQERQIAQESVSEDVARVVRFNNRVVCTPGGTADCWYDLSSDPGESGYISANYSPDATTNYFRDRCINEGGTSLADVAAGLLTESNVPPPTSLNNASIQRYVTIASSQDRRAHRYTVTWKQGEKVIRQLTLVPQVAAWCP